MKLYGLLLTIAALAMGSCVHEHYAPVPAGGEDRSVRFSMSLPGAGITRAMDGADETAVATVDVLAFYDDGHGIYRYAYAADDIRRSELTVTARVKGYPSAQMFVVLVNAAAELSAADIAVNEPLDAAMRKLVCTSGVQGQWNARNNGSSAFDPIPMYAKTDPVVVDAEGKLIGSFPLIRMLARVDIKVASGMSDFKLTDARVYNQKTAGYVAYDFSGFAENRAWTAAVPEANTNTGAPILPGTVAWAADHTTDAKGVIERSIYVYESPAYGESGRLTGTAIVVGGEYDGVPGYWRINLKTTDDGDATRLSSHILRNHLYHVEIRTISGPGYETPEEAYKGENRLTATVTRWDLAPQDVADRQWWLSIDKDELFLSGVAETAEITAKTNYNILSQGFEPGLQIDFSATVYVSGHPGWLTVANVTGDDGDLSRTIRVAAEENQSGIPRSATIDLKAGNLTKTVYVSQNFNISDGGNPLTANTYVGAFWRADQTGERLININPGTAGNWSVRVYSYGDFKEGDILFSTAPSKDPYIYSKSPADMNIPENDTYYNVSDGATTVSGTLASASDGIFFRIGLKTKWSPTADKPARYAVIVLTHDGSNQKIWLRQGHGDDYLIRNNTDGTSRTYARKYSPYNLTASQLTDQYYFVQLSVKGGVFTAYPSQAGAFFQFASNNKRYAFNPYRTGLTSSWSGINTATYSSDQETCPPGYRRPAGGYAYQSEIAQSLWADLSNDGKNRNMVWGYYADGFFDRRTIGRSPVSSAGTRTAPYSAVATETNDVAYIGMLFYNANTNASLFFPAPGYRDRVNGSLASPGYSGLYWSDLARALEPEGAAFCMNVNRDLANFDDETFRAFGFPLRCVKVE